MGPIPMIPYMQNQPGAAEKLQKQKDNCWEFCNELHKFIDETLPIGAKSSIKVTNALNKWLCTGLDEEIEECKRREEALAKANKANSLSNPLVPLFGNSSDFMEAYYLAEHKLETLQISRESFLEATKGNRKLAPFLPMLMGIFDTTFLMPAQNEVKSRKQQIEYMKQSKMQQG